MADKKTAKTIHEYHLSKNQPNQPQFAVHNLSDYLEEHGESATKPHIHSFYQIIWFKQGSGKHFVDFKAYNVHENIVFFIAKNQVHYFDFSQDYTGILIHFNEVFLAQNENEIDFFLKGNIFNDFYKQPFSKLGNDSTPIFEEYILQMEREFINNNEFGKEELLRAYLKSFLIQIHRIKIRNEEADNEVSLGSGEKRLQLLKFGKLIDEHYHKGYTVNEYANLLFVSPRSLSNLTQQLLNKTPSQMIQERIILEAQRLLFHSNLNTNQIGYRLGFDDPSYFLKYFKKHSHISPRDFRKSIS